jgi:penicillin amidase
MIHILDFAGNMVWSTYSNTWIELYGCYLAGTPFPLLGHNRDYATAWPCLKWWYWFIESRIVLGMGINIKLLQVLVITIREIIKERHYWCSAECKSKSSWSRHEWFNNGLDNNEPVAMSWIIHNNPFIFSMRFTLFTCKKTKQIFKGFALISARD